MANAFVRNYSDHSNDTGYQFEFHCDKCGNGYRSSFQTSTLGVASQMLKAAGQIFGGRFWQMGAGADHVKDALRGPAWDSAYNAAVEEIRPKFHQCTRCGNWVCPEVCWNEKRGLCEACAPDLQEEASHIQANVAVEQAWDKGRQSDQTAGLDMSTAKVAACPHCNARLASPDAKFCGSCGKPVQQQAAAKFCAQCGTGLAAGARFCAQCGTPA